MNKRTYHRISWGNLDWHSKDRPDEYNTRQWADGHPLRGNAKLRKGNWKQRSNFQTNVETRKAISDFERGLFRRMKDLQDYVRDHSLRRLTMECTLSLHHADMNDLQGIWGVEPPGDYDNWRSFEEQAIDEGIDLAIK